MSGNATRPSEDHAIAQQSETHPNILTFSHVILISCIIKLACSFSKLAG
jgi:hypothetical protein